MLGLVLLVLAISCVFRARAQDIFVSNEYTTATCTTGTRNCPDLASALALSGSFDSIYVRPGIYNGTSNSNLCIASCTGLEGVEIRGLGLASDVIITSSGRNFADSIAMYIFGNTITAVSNITIQGFSNAVDEVPSKVGATMVVINSAVSLENVIFNNNSGIEGGAIHARNSSVALNGTRFERNTAKLHGGAVMLTNSNAVFTGCSFRDNNVTTDPAALAGTGGAIYFFGVNDLTIVDSEFVGNRAEIAGGAVFMTMNSNTAAKVQRGKFQARNSLFQDNTVSGLGNCVSSGACNSRGGALFISALSTSVESSRFENNAVLSTSTSTVRPFCE
jgi:hypothetical protein